MLRTRKLIIRIGLIGLLFSSIFLYGCGLDYENIFASDNPVAQLKEQKKAGKFDFNDPKKTTENEKFMNSCLAYIDRLIEAEDWRGIKDITECFGYYQNWPQQIIDKMETCQSYIDQYITAGNWNKLSDLAYRSLYCLCWSFLGVYCAHAKERIRNGYI